MLFKFKCLFMVLAVIACVCLFSPPASPLEIIAGPYLQYPTTTSMIVRWETDQSATSETAYGLTVAKMEWLRGEGESLYHEVRLESLVPGGFYFYQVKSTASDGAVIESERYTFQTAVDGETPFSFAVFSDTQSNPNVVSALAQHAWNQRPQFTVLTGDLVSDGNVKEDWLYHFFPNMHVLNSRVPLIPCLGNHDEDSKFYYDYFSLPEPEYCYRFPYGNTEIFVIDSNRRLMPSSDQYKWLDEALGSSNATWKIVCMHRPAYSSDEDDYGDTKEGQPMGGDPMQRAAVELYEKHGVDILWTGHIHSYERTHPLLHGKPALKGGVLYMITGGGGGGLEKTGPWRLPITAKVYSGHHYCMVTVHGPTLRIEAYNLEGNLFDFIELRK
jgi:acid phosphatase type 7